MFPRFFSFANVNTKFLPHGFGHHLQSIPKTCHKLNTTLIQNCSNNTHQHQQHSTSTSRRRLRSYPTGGKKSAPPQVYLPDIVSFTPDTSIPIPLTESHHLRVLHLSTGSPITLFNSKGNLASATLLIHQPSSSSPSSSSPLTAKKSNNLYYANIVSRIDEEKKHEIHKIHILINGLKNSRRSDTLVEKLTELNIQQITFVNTNTNSNNRLQRWCAVSAAAAKQSMRPGLPIINLIHTWSDVLNIITEQDHQICIVLCADGHSLVKGIVADEILKKKSENSDVLIVVGGEEGLTNDQIKDLVDKGALKVSLGRLRLRVETAAILAAGIVGQILDVNNINMG